MPLVPANYRTDAAADAPDSARVRYDVFDLAAPVERDDGTLLMEGRLAQSDVYPYPSPGAPDYAEYVPTETLADPEWLEGVAHGPVTLDHPDGGVTPETYGDHTIGHVDGQIDASDLYERDADGKVVVDGKGNAKLRRSGGFVGIRVAVGRRDGIDAVKRGTHRQLSPGYKVDLARVDNGDAAKWLKSVGRTDETAGIAPNGKRYQAIQTKRYAHRGSHSAIVPAARGGAGCSLRADGNAYLPGAQMDPKLLEDFLKLDHGMTKADAEAFCSRTDGALMARQMVDAHCALDMETDAHKATQKKLDEMTTAMDAVRKTCDALQNERRTMEADVPPGDKKDAAGNPAAEPLPTLMARWSAHRTARVALAKKHGVTVTDAMSNRDIEQAIVVKHDAKATGRSVDFYDARCDALAEDRTDAKAREDAKTAFGPPVIFNIDGNSTSRLPPPAPGLLVQAMSNRKES